MESIIEDLEQGKYGDFGIAIKFSKKISTSIFDVNEELKKLIKKTKNKLRLSLMINGQIIFDYDDGYWIIRIELYNRNCDVYEYGDIVSKEDMKIIISRILEKDYRIYDCDENTINVS